MGLDAVVSAAGGDTDETRPLSQNGTAGYCVKHALRNGRELVSVEMLPVQRPADCGRRRPPARLARQRYLLLMLALLTFAALLFLALYMQTSSAASRRGEPLSQVTAWSQSATSVTDTPPPEPRQQAILTEMVHWRTGSCSCSRIRDGSRKSFKGRIKIAVLPLLIEEGGSIAPP